MTHPGDSFQARCWSLSDNTQWANFWWSSFYEPVEDTKTRRYLSDFLKSFMPSPSASITASNVLSLSIVRVWDKHSTPHGHWSEVSHFRVDYSHPANLGCQFWLPNVIRLETTCLSQPPPPATWDSQPQQAGKDPAAANSQSRADPTVNRRQKVRLPTTAFGKNRLLTTVLLTDYWLID